eukprot:5928777-Pleurochrysis_carterae.AAC.1
MQAAGRSYAALASNTVCDEWFRDASWVSHGPEAAGSAPLPHGSEREPRLKARHLTAETRR